MKGTASTPRKLERSHNALPKGRKGRGADVTIMHGLTCFPGQKSEPDSEIGDRQLSRIGLLVGCPLQSCRGRETAQHSAADTKGWSWNAILVQVLILASCERTRVLILDYHDHPRTDR